MPVRAQPLPLPPVIIPPSPRPALPAVTWTDPDGGMWNLADLSLSSGLIATVITGTGGPPVAPSFLSLPSGGQIAQSILPQPHVITLGLYAEAVGLDQDGFLDLINQITRAFYTVRAGRPAAGTLTIQQPNGSSRQMTCYTTAGLDQPNATDIALLQTQWALTLQGTQYWSDSAPQAAVVFAAPPAGAGVPPLPPVTLGSSTTLGATSVNNTGDADAYPTWAITGPGTPTITNSTTGRTWSFDTSVPGGATWTVVSAPDGRASVTDQAGTSQWQHLAAGVPRDLWTLLPGVNNLNIALAGSGTGSQVAMTYTRNWLRA